MTRRLALAPLTDAAFAPFGRVIAAPSTGGRLVNQGRALRHDGLYELDAAPEATRFALVPITVRASPLPFPLAVLERHSLSAQAFAPVRAARLAVVVAPDGADGRPDLARLVAFAAGSGTAFLYRRGVWHAPMIALDGDAELLMLMFETPNGPSHEDADVGEAIEIVG
jgi:ureidoglycolate lyase